MGGSAFASVVSFLHVEGDEGSLFHPSRVVARFHALPQLLSFGLLSSPTSSLPRLHYSPCQVEAWGFPVWHHLMLAAATARPGVVLPWVVGLEGWLALEEPLKLEQLHPCSHESPPLCQALLLLRVGVVLLLLLLVLLSCVPLVPLLPLANPYQLGGKAWLLLALYLPEHCCFLCLFGVQDRVWVFQNGWLGV